jgi:NAD(P)-dependent dehydrogenase (short-subunit alcohol dehydrogenase family)
MLIGMRKSAECSVEQSESCGFQPEEFAMTLNERRKSIRAGGFPGVRLRRGEGNAACDAFYASEAACLPVGRAGEVEEIAKSYLYLIRQTYVTGQALYVDGGLLAWSPCL